MTTEQLLEKSFEVYKPSEVIEYWKQGIWGAGEVKEKLEGFIERHNCHKSQDSGCPCDSWRGIVKAIEETTPAELEYEDSAERALYEVERDNVMADWERRK